MSSLLKRVSNALSTGMHDLLDSSERPDAIVRQLLRETSDAVASARTMAVEAVASEKQLEREVTAQQQAVDSWQKDAANAMASGDEVNARSALKQKLAAQSLLNSLLPQQQTAASNSEVLKARLTELEQSLNELKARQKALVARQKGAQAISESEKAARNFQNPDDLQARLQRAESLVESMEVRNAAEAEIAAVVNPELNRESTRQADQLEAELAALRVAK